MEHFPRPETKTKRKQDNIEIPYGPETFIAFVKPLMTANIRRDQTGS